MSPNVLPCAVALLSVCAGSLWIYAYLRPRHTTTAQGSELAAAKQSLSGTAPLPSLLIPCITSHRRTIPTSAIHSFSYPLVYLGVDLDALEAGHLDLGWSRGFVYGGRAWTAVLGIQQGQYLDAVDRRKTLAPRTESQEDPFEGGVGRSTGAKRDSESAPEATIPKDLDRESMASGPSTPSFRSRLLKLLASHGIPAALVGRVWLLTMPSYLGISGINPLTTYFVYRSSSPLEGKEEGDKQGQGPRLLCMVLEVHNTFEERHLYVLRTGLNEDDPSTLTSGHTYSWTFPRSFHVSPFNNRKGYYRLAVQDPFHPSSRGVSTMTTFPKFKVTLNLLTAELEPKLYAVLMNHPTQSPGPITLRNILVKVLYRQPFSLLMTTPRILAQAYSERSLLRSNTIQKNSRLGFL
ncbi:hypothetical protein QFC19_004100 [Naganishia cerealis]|uniref:Uncharacterized protein n=1 Tax=Naganishia cerealis TaxID=610337 RepID=A0ACC2VZ89_9TREE|nr:hypothetical protein QFC19_004100 [Naganishia cerealis]